MVKGFLNKHNCERTYCTNPFKQRIIHHKLKQSSMTTQRFHKFLNGSRQILSECSENNLLHQIVGYSEAFRLP